MYMHVLIHVVGRQDTKKMECTLKKEKKTKEDTIESLGSAFVMIQCEDDERS